MSTTGEKGGRPLKAGVPVADFMSGATLYGAITTALFERERTGRGRKIEVSMLESLYCTLLPSAGHVYASNKVPQRTGNRHVADSYVPFDTFEASDGWIALVCATDEHWINLTHAMDRTDLRDDASLHRLKGRIERIEWLTQEINDWAARHTRDEITRLCQMHHIPCAPLRYVNEVLEDPHLLARGFLTTQHTADGRTIALPNSPIRFEGSERRTLAPAPGLGEHTEQVLAELCGLNAQDIAALHRDGVI